MENVKYQIGIVTFMIFTKDKSREIFKKKKRNIFIPVIKIDLIYFIEICLEEMSVERFMHVEKYLCDHYFSGRGMRNIEKNVCRA